MLMGSGPVSGSLSGNLSRASQLKYRSPNKEQHVKSNLSSTQKMRGNGTFDDISDESDDNLMIYEDRRDNKSSGKKGGSFGSSKGSSPSTKRK